MPAASLLKQQAHAVIDQLPDTATWDDVVYELAVRRSIERGLADSEARRTTSHEDVLKEFSIAE